MKILVTGATGFIGQAIIERLSADVSAGFEITGVARRPPDVNCRDFRFISVDVTDKTAVSAFSGSGQYDAVVHSAGLAHQFGNIDDDLFEKVNVRGTENIAELASRTGCRHFILIGSTAVYGAKNGPIDETALCTPETAYAASKLKAEDACRRLCEKNNIPLTIFRLAPVLGEKGVGNVPRLIQSIHKKHFIWLGDGENQKSLIYVGDVARASKILLKRKTGGTEIFNLAADPVSMKKLVRIISDELQTSVPHFSIPAALPKAAASVVSRVTKIRSLERLSKTIDKWLCDDIFVADLIEKAYGFRPGTSVEEAVRNQCKWFLEESK